MSHRLDYFFRQKVTEAELDLGFTQLENADRALSTDWGITGICSQASVSQKSGTPNLTVDISGPGVIYDKLGQRINFASLQNVNVAVDSSLVSTAVVTPGNEKIVSVFAKFTRTLTDPRLDGNSMTVYFSRAEGFEFVVRQGSEGAPPATPPALDAEYILLADIRRSNGQTQILNADITPPGGSYIGHANRREDVFVATAGSFTLRQGTVKTALSSLLNTINSLTLAGTSVVYGGGAAWLDAATNPSTTVEAQLDKIINDLILTTANSGAHKIGCGARTTWLGGRTNVAGSVFAAIDKIITDLAATTPSDDGAERVGATSTAGSPDSLSTGSVRSQLDALLTAVNARARLASTETISAVWTHTQRIAMSGASAYLSYAGASSGAGHIVYEQVAGTGANAGIPFIIVGQHGQAQAGGAANNDGGAIRILAGLAGTGGAGAAGVAGHVQLDSGSGRKSFIGGSSGTLASGASTTGLRVTRGADKALPTGRIAFCIRYTVTMYGTADNSKMGSFVYMRSVGYDGATFYTAGTQTTLHAQHNFTGGSPLGIIAVTANRVDFDLQAPNINITYTISAEIIS